MATDDLNSIPGLADKHLRALARQEVTDLRGLAGADQREIYKAMANIRPRPSLDRVAQWQEAARARLGEPAAGPEAGPADWQTVASFAVIFARRQAAGAWERHIAAEQTEVEPEQDRRVWNGWDIAPVGRWMAGQLPEADSGSAPDPADPTRRQTASPADSPRQEAADPADPLEQEAARAARAVASGASRLTIERATVTGADGAFDVIAAGVLVTGRPAVLTAPVRVAFTVGGAPEGTALRAVTRLLRPDGPGWNPRVPAAPDQAGQAEFDLSAVPADRYDVTLIAWAPDGTARPVSARLPPLTIRPAGVRTGNEHDQVVYGPDD